MFHRILFFTVALLIATAASAQQTVVRSSPEQLEIRKANTQAFIQARRDAGRLTIDGSAIAATYGGLLQGEAALYFRSGDIVYDARDWLDPSDKSFKRTFHWNTEDAPKATGAVWQVSSHPFPPALSISDDPFAPKGLMRSGYASGKIGNFNIDFAVLAQELDLRAKPVQATLNRSQITDRTTTIIPKELEGEDVSSRKKATPRQLQKKTTPQIQTVAPARGALLRSDAVLASYIAAGGTATFYVRVLPVLGDAQNHQVIGFPSPIGEIRYGNRPPPENPFEGFEWSDKEIPNIAVTAFSYTPWRFDSRWPKGCTVFRGGNDYWNPLDFLLDAWDWASEAYADIKAAVIDLTAGFLPFVPREAFEIALDVALASAGVPPTLPNIDQMMEEGAGYLAEEAAAQITGPAGSALSNEIAGELFDEAVPALVAKYGADELHNRVQDELKRRLKNEIQSSAQSARAAVESKAEDMRCQTREYQPTIRLTVRNRSNKRYTDVPISIGDEVGIFKGHTPKITLRPNESYDLIFPMYPDFWKISARNNVSLYQARDIYWRDYAETPTKFYVRGPNTAQCFESEYGYVMECRAAPPNDPRPLRFLSPDVLLSDAYRL